MAERSLSRVIQGMTLRGTYCVRDGIVTVNTPFGSKSTQVIGGSKPASMAYTTARELGDAATTNGISSLTRTATMSRASPPLCGDPE
jgi:hypothetical protein